MPETKQVPQIQQVDFDSEPFKFGLSRIEDNYALSLVKQLFPIFENFRSINHDRRWNNNDSLYFGWLPPKVWDGTNTPRASLGIPIVFDQVESAVPAICEALFSIGPEWFDVEAEPGTDPNEARGIQASMSYRLEHGKDNLSVGAKTEIKLAIKDICLYGNGGVEVNLNPATKNPFVQYIDLKDFYIDPGCPTPDIEEARAVIRRKLMTVEDLVNLRDAQGFRIPDEGILNAMAKSPLSVFADQTRRTQEGFRGISWQPGASDYFPIPSERKIEVLILYSKSRIIWVLNREWVAFNGKNPYGFYPFVFAPCYIVPSRFYAMSMADVQEGNQRIIEALLNARLDEINLSVHPPRVVKRGVLMTPSQQKWRPGALYQAENPKDLQLLQPNSVLTNVYNEIQFLELAAEKRTGLNGASQGNFRPGNVNRTATGVTSQLQGANNRLREVVSNIEEYLILPMLYKLYKITQNHVEPWDMLPAQTTNGDFGNIPAWLYQKPVKFRMNAASRMMTKQVMQQLFPFLLQYLMNGNFVSSLQQVGWTVDFPTIARMLQDSTGTSTRYTLLRELSEQEKQQIQQAQQQQRNPEMMKQQQDSETKLTIAREKNQTEIQKAQIAKQPDNSQIQIEQMKMEIEKMKALLEMQIKQQEAILKAKSEEQLNRIKQQASREEAQLKLQMKQAEIGMKMQDSAIKIKTSQQEALNQQQIQQMQFQNETQRAMTEHALGLGQKEEMHKQGLRQQEEAGSMKMQQEKMRLSSKPQKEEKKESKTKSKRKLD